MRYQLVLIVVFAATGCGGSARPVEATAAPPLVVPSAEPAPIASASPAPSASARAPAIDWIEAGVPAPDRLYTPDDYRRVALAVARIARDGRGRLPRSTGSDAALFAHWVDPRQLASLGDASLPASERSIVAQGLLSQVPRVFQQYLPGNDGVDFAEEQVAWVAFLFELESRALRLSTGLEAGSKRNDAVRDPQLQMFFGTAEGALSLIAESASRSGVHRARLAKSLADALERLRGADLGPKRSELATRVDAASGREPEPSVRAELQRAVAAARDARPRSKDLAVP